MATTEPRWRRRPEERPGQILEAALAEFSERGLEATRVEDIAERAGIGKATLYQYFPNKLKLFHAVVRRGLEGLTAAMSVETDPEATASAALASFIRSVWAQVRAPEFEAAYRLAQAEVNKCPSLTEEYVRSVREPFQAAVTTLLERGVAAGEFEAGDAVMRSRMLLALLTKHAVWCARREYMPDLIEKTDDEVMREMTDFYYAALGAAPGREA